jgi:hypothetical protein
LRANRELGRRDGVEKLMGRLDYILVAVLGMCLMAGILIALSR